MIRIGRMTRSDAAWCFAWAARRLEGDNAVHEPRWPKEHPAILHGRRQAALCRALAEAARLLASPTRLAPTSLLSYDALLRLATERTPLTGPLPAPALAAIRDYVAEDLRIDRAAAPARPDESAADALHVTRSVIETALSCAEDEIKDRRERQREEARQRRRERAIRCGGALVRAPGPLDPDAALLQLLHHHPDCLRSPGLRVETLAPDSQDGPRAALRADGSDLALAIGDPAGIAALARAIETLQGMPRFLEGIVTMAGA